MYGSVCVSVSVCERDCFCVGERLYVEEIMWGKSVLGICVVVYTFLFPWPAPRAS